ncbi:MAG: hypothetical protein ABIO55_06100 [Ginsengibacter sp.]
MGACSFEIPFSGNASEILSKAKTAVQSQDGTFNGDESNGDFYVSVLGNVIKGSYNVAGQNLNIVIDSKPFLIPCSTIESFLKNKIGG